ncbi:MAG TPA: MarR family transcriptional regulator [Thermoanaerobaculia bacterium]|nr:MarR family transcriptional regulator [Thermoanaerobaculia bacterium]
MARTSSALRQPGPDAELAAEVAEFYDALQELLRVAQFRDRERICCYDISITECYSLEALDRHGPLMLNRLAAELRLDKSTASRVAAALEEKGYVRRDADPADRRALRLGLTPRGAALHARIRRDIETRHAALLAGLDPATRRAATGLLRRLAADLCCSGAPAADGCRDGCG